MKFFFRQYGGGLAERKLFFFSRQENADTRKVNENPNIYAFSSFLCNQDVQLENMYLLDIFKKLN